MRSGLSILLGWGIKKHKLEWKCYFPTPSLEEETLDKWPLVVAKRNIKSATDTSHGSTLKFSNSYEYKQKEAGELINNIFYLTQ